ncbi:helix-turn-helix domain-containing protein [Paracandidimonas soli]|uniref:Helix-turn-helix protein n=1 Tax=Paracandidimonas soli TaxID=1917182 RepID=A0A4R3V3T8_9BURK|nr:helix-turn-helix domain-containing protein [Paracandidimonas soli]TCU98340.1 helix-turn-helix protein [Paracandidimonas soli]
MRHKLLRVAEEAPSAASAAILQPVVQLSDIGWRIREVRRAQGLRIDDAASLCGVSVDLLSRLENGKGGIGTDKVLQVLSGLGLQLLVASKEHTGLRRLIRQDHEHD